MREEEEDARRGGGCAKKMREEEVDARREADSPHCLPEERGAHLPLLEEEHHVEAGLFDVPELLLEVGELAVRLLPKRRGRRKGRLKARCEGWCKGRCKGLYLGCQGKGKMRKSWCKTV